MTTQNTPLYSVHTDRASDPVPMDEAFRLASKHVALSPALRAACTMELQAKGWTGWAYGFTSVHIAVVPPVEP